VPKRRAAWTRDANPNAPELLATLREHARMKDLQLFVGDGWLPLVRECHEAVVAEFPDYELLAVKQKYAELAFQAFPVPWAGPDTWTDEEHSRLDEIVDSFRARSAAICERCGGRGEVRSLDGLLLTVCGPCFVASGGSER
jgi:hypothetical protein